MQVSATAETDADVRGRRRAAGALVALLGAIVAFQMTLFSCVEARRPGSLETPDTPTYEQPAHALMALGRFSSSIATPDDPEVTRTPGYPLFIGVVGSSFGQRRAAPVLAGIVVGALGLAMLYAAARRLGLSRTAALATVAVAGLDPGSVLASQMLMPETLFTALLTCTLYFGVRLAEGGRRSPGFALAAGIALAATTQVRPIAYFFIVPMLAWLWMASRASGGSRKNAVVLCALMFAPWLVLIGGWQVRNAVVFGDATFSQIQNVNLYRYRGADVVSLRDGISLDEAQARLQAAAEQSAPAGPERFRYFKDEGIRILKAYPSLAVRSALRGLAKTIAGPGCIDLYMHVAGPLPQPGPLSDALHLPFGRFWQRWVRGYPGFMALLSVEALFLGALYLGSAVALVLGWGAIRRSIFPHALWWGCLVYFLVISAGPEAYARFRVPVTPILACYAVMGATLVAARLRSRRLP